MHVSCALVVAAALVPAAMAVPASRFSGISTPSENSDKYLKPASSVTTLTFNIGKVEDQVRSFLTEANQSLKHINPDNLDSLHNGKAFVISMDDDTLESLLIVKRISEITYGNHLVIVPSTTDEENPSEAEKPRKTINITESEDVKMFAKSVDKMMHEVNFKEGVKWLCEVLDNLGDICKNAQKKTDEKAKEKNSDKKPKENTNGPNSFGVPKTRKPSTTPEEKESPKAT